MVSTKLIESWWSFIKQAQTKWNWGAFFLPLWFAFANRSYLNLLVLIPVLNIFWVFYGAYKGESWARNNTDNDYRSEHEFRAIMDSWNRAGIAGLIFMIVGLVIYLIAGATAISTLLSLGTSLN